MKKVNASNAERPNGKFIDSIKSYPITIASICISIIVCIILCFYNYIAAIAGFVILAIFIIAFGIGKNFEINSLKNSVKLLQNKFSPNETGELNKFPLPVVIINNEDKIIWYNKLFDNEFIEKSQAFNIDIKEITNGKDTEYIKNNRVVNCKFNEKEYTAVTGSVKYKKLDYAVLYFIEDTKLKQFEALYNGSKPVVMLLSFDTIDEYLGDFRESQQAEILSGLELIIEEWISKYTNSILKKILNGKFILFTDKSTLRQMMDDKFEILSMIRSYSYNGKAVGITLSIGVGYSDNLPLCEKYSRQALDMALGRGGDQVAVKTGENSYEFFGGVTKGIEKRTKVKTRIVASAIGETIKQSSNVLVMGHRFSDLDALGSAVGVASICRALQKNVNIVMTLNTTLAEPLYKAIVDGGYDDLVIEPQDAEKLINDKTLLIIVDTHRQSFLDSPELFDKVKSIVVIDHHRKTVDHINKAMVFYHEPNASSASEMVTELIEYINENIELSEIEANALLSGITLDTKNFVMNTGVRTFEAAAYLRGAGADTIAVKQLFANSMATQKSKSTVVKNAQMYKNSAIGVVDFSTDNIRIIASQAADELLNVANVDASFVMFVSNGEVDISARSFGKMNVQIVMEELGGGGHQTMAAAQIPNVSIEDAFDMLKNAIDKVNEMNKSEV